MKRVGFVLKIRQELIVEYTEHHKKLWPEMKETLKKNGWDNYSLFIRKDGLLFGYFEAKNSFADSLKKMSKEEVNTRWQKMMTPYFEIPSNKTPDTMMIQLEEIFHID